MLRKSICLCLILCVFLPVTTLALDYPKLTSAQRTANQNEIYSFLTSTLGCNKATACGILANLQQESDYNPQAVCIDVNGLISYGLCQWNGYRNNQLRDFCSKGGMDYKVVGPQLKFMWWELNNTEKDAWGRMQSFPNTAQGAYDAAVAWARYFERCYEIYWAKRGTVAKKLFGEMADVPPPSQPVTPVTPVTPPKPDIPDILDDVEQYTPGQFSDVAKQWFAPYVEIAVEKGLIKGTTGGKFNPYGEVTVAEAVTMACRIHSRYENDGEKFKQIGAWYNTYFTYAKKNELIDNDIYYGLAPNQPTTREQFARILVKALPEEALPAINKVPNGMIPDVSTSAYYAGAVYLLYKAGVLTGGTNYQFFPDTSIQRSEASAILARLAAPSERKYF